MSWINVDQLILVGTPVVRGIAGWIENALADGKIDAPEWRELIGTVLRLGVPAAFLYYGMDMPIEFAASLPVLADYVYKYIKKIVEKAKQ